MLNKKPRILLIQPWIYDIAAYDFWIQPMGLMYVAAYLERMGCEVIYLNCLDPFHESIRGKLSRLEDGRGKYYRQELDKPDILKNIPRKYCRYGLPENLVVEELEKAGKVDAIFITSMMTYWYPGIKRVVELCREYKPDCPIVLGGVYTTLMPDHAMKTMTPEYLIEGQVEGQIVSLMKRMFPGVIFREIGNNIAFPAWHLAKNLSYLPVLTSRGCYYRCSYCAASYFYSGYRQRDYRGVIDEIRHFSNKYRLKDVVFYDDALLIDPANHFLKIMRGLREEGLQLCFHSPNGLSARQINDEVAEAMFQAKFETVRISLETASDEKHELYGKKVTRKEFESAMRSLLKAGYKQGEVGVYLLGGMRCQQKEEILDSIKLVYDNGGIVKFSLYSPIPRTRDFDEFPEHVREELLCEPLLQNNSVFSHYFGYLNMREYEEIKAYIETFRDYFDGK